MSNPLVNPLLKQREPQLSLCPVCHGTCAVKTTKKDKPYLICDPCGVQLFVRGKAGIQRFETQNAALEKDNIWKRLAELESRYLLQCPKCGKKFWLEPKRVRKAFPGTKLLGYRCPEPGCDGTVDLEGMNSKESKQEKAA